MSYKFTKLSDVLSVSELPEGANAIIESNGEIKRCPSSDKFPNPNPLTFTGAVEGSYDGSEPLTVNIPSGSDATYDDTELRQRVDAIEAKESIWDAKSNFSGSYNDLTDKPIITNNTTVFYLSND